MDYTSLVGKKITIHVRLQTTITLKFLTPYVNMDLQQPHIYFDAQIYTKRKDMGIKLLSCVNGVRFCNHKTLINAFFNNKRI
ncbi:hypothetical protein DF947_17755 [Pedobacter paludis]|uniref:Uncharacterized protein n=1 Tax=Pedobacter paludis TaxID=2203212 RepID=A0A317EYF2_9SPHI|nr:hypothetical protein DF947_17755 [Pedobacter paludis]